MANWEFYDEGEEIDGVEDQEPSFSLHDFRKWLSSQKDTFREGLEERKQNAEQLNKEELKEAFKNKIREQVQKNIDRKLAERKKKKS